MIFCSSNYQPDYKLFLPFVIPFHYLFGTGRIEEFRRTKISLKECLKHHLKISCHALNFKNVINLVIGHIFSFSEEV